MKRFAYTLLAASTWIACAAGPSGARLADCAEGEERACTCPNGAPGSQRCNGLGLFDVCACGDLPSPNADASAPYCGDGRCDEDESCRSCSQDCGECLKCGLAPSCSDAVGAPSKPAVRADLSQPPGDAGAPAPQAGGESCKDPELRLRIERITVHQGGGQIYCVVSATDGATSEAAVTGKTTKLSNGESNYFDAASAIYWGQKELHRTTNNLTVTLNCFVVKGDSWAKVLGAMGDTAKDLGGTPTPSGWAFGLGGVAANAAAAAVQAGAGDDLRFNAQQTIDKADLLDLTNGRTWSIRKGGGCGLFCEWDWEVHLQSWGCADAHDRPR